MTNISVIIPTWNRAQETQRAVTSVLKQTYQNFEVLIADDGSDDQTEEIFRNFPDERIKYIRLEHSGSPVLPRNEALFQAQGEFIAFLDSDDEWLPNKLELQVPILENNSGIDLVCSNAYRIVNNQKRKRRLYFKKPLNVDNNFLALVQYNNFVITSSVLARKHVLLKTHGFSESIDLKGVEDFELWARICTFDNIKYLHKPLLNYYDFPSHSHRSDISKRHYFSGMLLVLKGILKNSYDLDRLDTNLEYELVKKISYYHRYTNDWKLTSPSDSSERSLPVVSVILPVSIIEKPVFESIHSILTQTLRAFELIIVCHGISDTVQLISNSIHDPRVVLVNQPNQGIVESIEKGINTARGRYIAFQFQDEISFPSRLEKQVALLNAHSDCNIAGICTETWIENQPVGRKMCFSSNDITFNLAMLLDELLVYRGLMFRHKIIHMSNSGSVETEELTSDEKSWSKKIDLSNMRSLPEVLQFRKKFLHNKTNHASLNMDDASPFLNLVVGEKEKYKRLTYYFLVSLYRWKKYHPVSFNFFSSSVSSLYDCYLVLFAKIQNHLTR